jgi:hypothetical protein
MLQDSALHVITDMILQAVKIAAQGRRNATSSFQGVQDAVTCVLFASGLKLNSLFGT